MAMRILDIWRRRAGQFKLETYAIYLAYKDPRVPWYAKVFIVCVIGYAFSPIDKFLDSVPIIGYLDHLLLVPIGVALAFRKTIPPAVLADCRRRARAAMSRKKPVNMVRGFIVVSVWFLFASLAIVCTTRAMKDWDGVFMWWLRWFMRMTEFQNHTPTHGAI